MYAVIPHLILLIEVLVMKEKKEMKEEQSQKNYIIQIKIHFHQHYNTKLIYVTQKKNRIYPESEDQNRRESLDNYGYLRQLNPSPKGNQYKPKPKANNNKLRGKRSDYNQSYQFGNNFNDDYDYNYKRVNKIKKPRRNDSLSSFKRRNDRSSSFGKTYRNQPRFFDDGYNCLTSSAFYCPIHGYQ